MKTLKEALFSRKNIKRDNPYGLTEDDLKGEIEGFPMGVVVRMLEEQELQGNKPDERIFQDNVSSDGEHGGGFDWGKTEARFNFWSDVLGCGNWKKFFKRYPDYEMYNL